MCGDFLQQLAHSLFNFCVNATFFFPFLQETKLAYQSTQEMSSASVAAQAELMEREKAVLEQQQRVESIQSTIKKLSDRQVALKISGRRSDITMAELSRLQPNHSVYRGMGRAFVKQDVNAMVDFHQGSKEEGEAEGNRLANEKMRAADSLSREEVTLRKAVEELRAAYQVITAMQQQQQQQQQQGK